MLYAGGGLKKFRARLGSEIDDVAAEFLDLALAHEQDEQPSLQGFLATLRTRDVVITTVLLLIGVVDVVTGFATFADFGPSLTLVYRQLGIDGTASSAIAAPYGVAINAVRIAVLAVTVVVSLLLIARRRRAFWAPLAGYVLAAIITSVLVATVMLNDPAYQAWLAQYQ